MSNTSETSSVRIIEVSESIAPSVDEHLARYMLESKSGGIQWLPYDPQQLEHTPVVRSSHLRLRYDQTQWERWYAVMASNQKVIGHLSLKGARFSSMLHRCELAMGLEQAFWRLGLGTQLIERAVIHAQSVASLEYLDLKVLSTNAPGRALYEKIGFREVSRIPDFFRIDGEPVADIFMSLRVNANGKPSAP